MWLDRKLRGNVHIEKMANKAEEWVGKVIWMSIGNGEVWELIGKLCVEHAAVVWWSKGIVHAVELAQMRMCRKLLGTSKTIAE